MSSALNSEAPRPGRLRRAAAGAWHVPAGFAFLVRKPRLWPWAALPALLAGACVSLGLLLGVYTAPRVEAGLLDQGLSVWLYAPLAATLWFGTLTGSMALGLGVALLLAAPVLDRLSRETELLLRGETGDATPGFAWEIAQSLKGGLYFLAAAPVVFLLGLIPIVGPFAGAWWAAGALSFQETETPLMRRGKGFAERRAWHRRYRAENLGFGLVALLVLVVPCANLLLAPALVIGATRLVLELEGP